MTSAETGSYDGLEKRGLRPRMPGANSFDYLPLYYYQLLPDGRVVGEEELSHILFEKEVVTVPARLLNQSDEGI